MTAITSTTDRPEALIARAAQATGADFDFLVRTAARESGFDARAQARTSSATGMFQFLDQTWLGMMHARGSAHGYGQAASAIERGSDGRYTVADPARRQEILDMRFDPEASALMAGELASANAEVLRSRIGREPTGGELYAAHFLGAGGASDLIQTAQSDPDSPASRYFPSAARANRPIFYDGGRPRTVAEVLDVITGGPAASPSSPVPNAVPTQDEAVPDAHSWSIRASGEGARAFSNAGVFAAVPRGAILSPAVVEILASLDAPQGARRT